MISNIREKPLLNDIFLETKTAPKKLIPIIKSSDKIPSIIPFLNDSKNQIKDKIDIISTLISLFKYNKNLIPCFIEKFTSNRYNFYEPLIKIYLDNNISNDGRLKIEDMIKLLNINITTPKSALEYVYQKLSNYFKNEGNNTNKDILTEKIMLKYLNLLKLLYSEEMPKNMEKNQNQIQIQDNINKSEKGRINTIVNKVGKSTHIPNYKVRNYIYFNGKDSKLSFKLNRESKNLNSDFPTLEYGFSFIFWIHLKKESVESFFKYFPSNIVSLINIEVVGHKIKLILKDINSLAIILDDKEIGKIELSKTKFVYNNWNFVCFYLTQKIKGKPPVIKLLINDNKNLLSISFPKNFPLNEIINSITLFENLVGRVTSVLFFSFCIDIKLIDYLRNNYTKGFFKNKYLFNFLYLNEREYFKNLKYYKYCNKFKKEKTALKLLNINLRNQNVKNLMVFFCPFAYNKKEKYIDDIFGHFLGVPGINDGVNYYENHSRSVQHLGGINNLLPIADIMFSCESKSKNISYPLIDKKILTEKTFYEYFQIIKIILLNHQNNINEAYNDNFFSQLQLFLERFSSHLFTENILNIYLEIGREAFQFSYDKFRSNNENFLSTILLNEKIIIKFSIQNMVKLWDTLYQFFTSDYSQMKGTINISKIGLLLRFYDDNRYNEYCCSFHANFFKSNNSNNNKKENIMNPEMNEKLGKFFDIIQLYLDKLGNEDEEFHLFKLLLLDFSPCIQKKIILTYSSHFINTYISKEEKIKTLQNLLNNDFFDVFEYVYSISLIDIRTELFTLLDNLLKDYSPLINQNLSKIKGQTDMKNIYDFIEENILPEQLIVKIENNNNINSINKIQNNSNEKKDNIEPLSKYFNQKEYEKHIVILWKLLNSWIFKTNSEMDPKRPNKLELNEIYLNFCISLVSKNIITNFINDFLLSIQQFMEKNEIMNIYIIYEKDYFFSWLIETIFYFNNKENAKDPKNKDIYEKIKTNSINVFQEIIKKIKDDKNKIKKMQFILNFSYKLKSMNKKNKAQLNEIETTTRILLKLMLENNNFDIDLISVVCYEFIIFYKNSDKFIGDDTNNNKDNKKSNELAKNDNHIIRRNLTSRILETKNNDFLLEDDNNDEDILNIKINYSSLLKRKDVIPDCIYESLFYFGDINSNVKGKPNIKGGLLNKIWNDFPMFEKMLNYYSENFWDLEHLCQKVKEDSRKKPAILYPKLLKEFGESKSYKNILYKDIIRLLNLNDIKNNEEFPLDLLKMNIQLLSIAVNLVQDKKEKEKIDKNIQNFIIYCIIASININSNEKNYYNIQDKLYYIIGFAILLLKRANRPLYKEIEDNLILPIFEQTTNQQNKKGLLKIFTKKNIFGKTCIFKLFDFGGKSIEENNAPLRQSTRFFKKMSFDPKNETGNFTDRSKSGAIDDTGANTLKFKGEIQKLLKHGFQHSLIYFKNKRVKVNLDDINTLYKYNSMTKDIINNSKERKRIYSNIKKLLPFFQHQIKKYSNRIFLSQKIKKNIYKSTKRKLFSWCGFWSDKNLFYDHPEMLKLKRMNHLTKEMTQILLKPILDFEYYLPNFKKFDKKQLFNKNNKFYQVKLDIDDILLDEVQIEYLKDKKREFIAKRNSNGFNYLECLYKYSYDDIWDDYLSFYERNINIEKIGLVNKNSYELLVSNKEIVKNIDKMKNENIYYCCLVKLTHHIRGYASTEEKRIIFIHEVNEFNSNNLIENDEGYDKDMQSCFGSIFKGHQKDKDKVNCEIKYENIKYLFIKTYFYNLTAVEIYTELNKSYLFVFKNNIDLTKFLNDILSHGEYREIKIGELKTKTIGYEQINLLNSKKMDYIFISKYEDWRNYSISTLELIMWLNIYSGRSYNDITQYPVFPWIITNYEAEELNEEADIRDLSSPIGMLELGDKSEIRKETFLEIYESVKNDLNELDPEFNYQEYLKNGEEYYNAYLEKKLKMKSEQNEDVTYIQPNQLPYFFGTHYSNPTYVSHYLTRIFPYSSIAIEIQGEKFDDPDRLFTSMKKTFESATTLKDDVRELIPEFYFLPEMFININNLNLSQNKKNANNDIAIVNDVELPPWAMSSSYNFVSQLRKSLESDKISINKWLNLIFGINQKGEKAEEIHNIYMGNSYQGNVKIESFNDPDVKNTLMRLVEVGMTPLKLFDNECKERIERDAFLSKNQIFANGKGKFFYESKNVLVEYIRSSKYKRISEHFYFNPNSSSNKDYKINIYPKIVQIVYLNKDYIKLFTNANLYFSMKITKTNEKMPYEESELREIENLSSIYSPSYLVSGIDAPIIIYDENKYMLKGGFWDGRIEISSILFEKKFSFCIFPNDDDPVLVMEMTEDEKYLLCGTKNGFIIAYLVNSQDFEILQKLFYHHDEITSISINNNLNMFATSSKDGLIMLHVLPTFKLIRTIKISINENEKEFVFGDNIFLSSSPIPCVTVYISSKGLFKTYSINGAQLFEITELENSVYIKCSKIIHDLNFQDILIYGTNNGFIKIRKFPDMSLINTIEFLDGKPIETFTLSQDHRFCFAYCGGDNIAFLSDDEKGENTIMI